jgi:hydroxymethylpyrimidine/phosphomethylpyrimidine kinase
LRVGPKEFERRGVVARKIRFRGCREFERWLQRLVGAGDGVKKRAAKQSAHAVRGRADPPACVLTIAGSDSGGGAGIQADGRAIVALGGYAATAITAITAQNTRGVLALETVSPRMLEKQISAVLEDLPIGAVKLGLIPSGDAVDAIARALRTHAREDLPVVIDPVLGSTSGKRFLAKAGVRRLKSELFSRALLVTPNWPEAEELSTMKITSPADAEAAARRIIEETGCRAVLVKGGHGGGRVLVDVLVKSGSAAPICFDHARIKSANTHGTGCVLSAAIAAHLARGWTLENAVGDAVEFLQEALVKSASLLWGGRGACLV